MRDLTATYTTYLQIKEKPTIKEIYWTANHRHINDLKKSNEIIKRMMDSNVRAQKHTIDVFKYKTDHQYTDEEIKELASQLTEDDLQILWNLSNWLITNKDCQLAWGDKQYERTQDLTNWGE